MHFGGMNVFVVVLFTAVGVSMMSYHEKHESKRFLKQFHKHSSEGANVDMDHTFFWAIYLCCISSVIMIIGTLIIAFTNTMVVDKKDSTEYYRMM